MEEPMIYDGIEFRMTDDGWRAYYNGQELGRPDPREAEMLNEICDLREYKNRIESEDMHDCAEN